jgi:glycosyltransferase involved in cell wall biosynthesis
MTENPDSELMNGDITAGVATMGNNDEPLVSVITPVYNGGQYLRECIESVLRQTYNNFEYIVLNNHSTDNTLAIAQEYAAIDDRVKVYSNDRLLAIMANHNHAWSLISAESKYCKFVCADDWLFPECISKMVSLGEAHPSVGLIGSYQLSGSGNDWRNWRVRWDEIPYPRTTIAARVICRAQMIEGVYVFGTPTSLMYRADLVRKRQEFYPNSRPDSDTSACYECLKDSDFGFVHQVLSYERVHEKQTSEESRTLNTYTPSRLSDLLEYGGLWLTDVELNKRVKEVLHDYYRFLAAAAVNGRDGEFWAYHKRRLAEANLPLSKLRLTSAILLKCVDLLLNPKRTMEIAIRRLKARRADSRAGTWDSEEIESKIGLTGT